MTSFEAWQAERLAALVAEDGWLNLTDRVEIPSGPQKIGRAKDNDLVLSVGPHHLGVVTATAKHAVLRVADQDLAFTAQGGNPMLRVLGCSSAGASFSTRISAIDFWVGAVT